MELHRCQQRRQACTHASCQPQILKPARTTLHYCTVHTGYLLFSHRATQTVRILVLVLILSSLILLTSLFHDKRTACGGIWFSDLWTTVSRICPVTLRRVMRLCRAACLARCAVCCGWYTGSLGVSYIVLCCSVKHDNRVDGCFFQHLCEHISYVSMLRMAYKE